ncbi:MAG: hypothetical protein V4733_03595 [Verrucomicrobiota bacterium]
MNAALPPAILATKECHDYVGGRPIWEELIRIYGSGRRATLAPFRRTAAQGKEYWLREVVDDVLRRAQLESALVAPKAQPDITIQYHEK